jgi:23S rRNA C2498 (ribose-2'-O)-methylase RlmM
MNWEDIVKAPQKRGSISFRVSDGKYSMISEENEATWLLQELVEQGANVEEVIDKFIVKLKLDDKETNQIYNILQPYLQAHEKAHNQIVNMDWKVDTKKYPKDKFFER